jgi:hypothetical protein
LGSTCCSARSAPRAGERPRCGRAQMPPLAAAGRPSRPLPPEVDRPLPACLPEVLRVARKRREHCGPSLLLPGPFLILECSGADTEMLRYQRVGPCGLHAWKYAPPMRTC